MKDFFARSIREKKHNVGAGYISLAEDVTAFSNAGCLPSHFEIQG